MVPPAAAPLGADEFAALMAPLGPFGPAPAMVAGVSGGPHSLALAVLAAGWAGSRGGRLIAGICDHGLRPESAAEARQAAALLALRGIPARVLPLALSPGPALQERARAARLGALLGLCAAEGAPWLLLGQHRADQAETVLLRALAGSGAAGLAGMAAARAAGPALLLRPLLGIAPARLEATLAAAGLAPLRDPSNADPRFARARLRAVLADPAGEGAAVAALAGAACRFAVRRGVAASAVARRLAAAASLHEAGFARLDLRALGRDRVAESALAGLLRLVAGRSFAPAAPSVAALLARGQGTLGGARLAAGGLLLREAAAMAGPVPAVPGEAWDRRFVLQGAVPQGCVIAAAGPAAAALPACHLPVPGAVRPTLPALWREGVLLAVPALGWRAPGQEAAPRFAFAPGGGPAA